VPVAPGQTLLEAGLAAGAELPFSCAIVGCGECKVVLTSGEVHSETSCLSDRERADGFVLACSARPKGRVSIQVP
jgi:ferredoxin